MNLGHLGSLVPVQLTTPFPLCRRKDRKKIALFRECSNLDGQIEYFPIEKLYRKANILLLWVDRKVTCKTWESNQFTIPYWLYPVLSAAVSKRGTIRKMLERDRKNRRHLERHALWERVRGREAWGRTWLQSYLHKREWQSRKTMRLVAPCDLWKGRLCKIRDCTCGREDLSELSQLKSN